MYVDIPMQVTGSSVGQHEL